MKHLQLNASCDMQQRTLRKKLLESDKQYYYYCYPCHWSSRLVHGLMQSIYYSFNMRFTAFLTSLVLPATFSPTANIV